MQNITFQLTRLFMYFVVLFMFVGFKQFMQYELLIVIVRTILEMFVFSLVFFGIFSI